MNLNKKQQKMVCTLIVSVLTAGVTYYQSNFGPAPDISTFSNASMLLAENEFEVVRVVDGDTIKIVFEGQEESVRLIGVDTPESVHPDSSKNTEFGETVSNFAKSKLEGKIVTLEFDEDQRDMYDRLLAYVHIDGEMFNKVLLAHGYAEVSTYKPNVRYEDDFNNIQLEAQANNLGMWAYN